MWWRRLWRRILILLGIRRITPRRNKVPGPWHLGRVLGDTGGGGWYRPKFREQDPSVDQAEPTDESTSAGNDHGWSNCTMAAGAMALDFHTLGQLQKWGGHLRHRQGDLDGGTDLYDLRDAWAYYGETLTIRTGSGWAALRDDRADGRAIVIQGEGNVPGSATFDGGHACVIMPETKDDGDWVWGDPLANDWQAVSESSIRDWAENWNTGISYAITAPHKPAEPEPEPEPEPVPPPSYLDGYEKGYMDGYGRGHDVVFASWFDVSPSRAKWDTSQWDYSLWGLRPLPLDAVAEASTPPVWRDSHWTAALWL